jgi:hypothetical protein
MPPTTSGVQKRSGQGKAEGISKPNIARPYNCQSCAPAKQSAPWAYLVFISLLPILHQLLVIAVPASLNAEQWCTVNCQCLELPNCTRRLRQALVWQSLAAACTANVVVARGRIVACQRELALYHRTCLETFHSRNSPSSTTSNIRMLGFEIAPVQLWPVPSLSAHHC